MSTTPEVRTDLIGGLTYARGGWGDWAKRVKAAGLPGWPLSLAESPRYTSQLWRQLCKDQRTWLTKSLIRVIDGEHQRDLWAWSNGLDLMRATHAPRT